MVPSSRMISQMTPLGLRPASRETSTAASVWPARTRTPPGRATSGKTWPGETIASGPFAESIATAMVRARSAALIPVEMPSFASIETVKAVSLRLRLVRVIGSSPSWSARSLVKARQMRPRPWRAMKLIASGVAICAGMTRSPSFSRPSSSTRMNMRPLRASLMIASVPTSTSAFPRWISFSSRLKRVGGRVPVRLAELAQAVGVKAGGAGEAGAADFAGGDDGFQPLDQGRAHATRHISH